MTSDSERDLALLQAEWARLDEQVKLLVRTEQRLYCSQNELDMQLQLSRALVQFSLGSVAEESADSVLHRAVRMLGDVFAIDDVAAVRLHPTESKLTVAVTMDGRGASPAIRCEAAAWNWLTELCEPAVFAAGAGTDSDLARRCAAAVLGRLEPTAWASAWTLAALPLRHAGQHCRGAIFLATFRARRVKERDGGLSERHQPFLQLLGYHVEHAIRTSQLTAHLNERSDQLVHTVESLERAQQALVDAQKMEAVGRLAGGVAHDFNNLLTVILGCGEELVTTLPPTSPLLPSAQGIVEAGRRAARITHQLLALGRRQIRRPTALALGLATTASMDVLRRLLGPQIDVQLEVDDDTPAVEADPTQFEQVLLNLVLNARDAMPDGGRLTLRIRRATALDARRCSGSLAPESFAVLEIEDTGVGMDAATRARIFEPFFSTKSSHQNSGLGLAVVYGVVQQSGGQVVVRSAPGAGTTFTVLLPRAERAAGPANHTPRVSGPATAVAPSTTRILVVEDSDEIRSLVVATLRRAGYCVDAAADAEQALRGSETSPWRTDLVLSDVMLPGMSGLRLAEELQRRHPGCRVALMSGHSDELAADMPGRGQPFLPKPFAPHELLDFVRLCLGQVAAR